MGNAGEGVKPETSQPEQDPSQLSGGQGGLRRRGEEKAAASYQDHELQPKSLGVTWTKGPRALPVAGLTARCS